MATNKRFDDSGSDEDVGSEDTDSVMMPTWISDNEIDPIWICQKIPELSTLSSPSSSSGSDLQQQQQSHSSSTLRSTKTEELLLPLRQATIVDISNETRKGNRPRDGATLRLMLTYSSSDHPRHINSHQTENQANDETKNAATTTTTTTTTKTKTVIIKQVPASGIA